MRNNLRIKIAFIVFITCILIPFIAGAKIQGEPQPVIICNESDDPVPVINTNNLIPFIFDQCDDIVPGDIPATKARINRFIVPAGKTVTINHISCRGTTESKVSYLKKPLVSVEVTDKEGLVHTVTLGTAEFSIEEDGETTFAISVAGQVVAPENTIIELYIESAPHIMTRVCGSLVGHLKTNAP